MRRWRRDPWTKSRLVSQQHLVLLLPVADHGGNGGSGACGGSDSRWSGRYRAAYYRQGKHIEGHPTRSGGLYVPPSPRRRRRRRLGTGPLPRGLSPAIACRCPHLHLPSRAHVGGIVVATFQGAHRFLHPRGQRPVRVFCKGRLLLLEMPVDSIGCQRDSSRRRRRVTATRCDNPAPVPPTVAATAARRGRTPPSVPHADAIFSSISFDSSASACR